MAYVEMRWRCSYCGKENLGRDRNCVGCSHPRDENVKFYMPGAGEITRVEHIETQEPDWICEYCDSLNKATKSTCESCGAPRYKESKDYFSKNKSDSDNISEAAQNRNQSEQTRTNMKPVQKNQKWKKRFFRRIFIFAAIILLIIAGKKTVNYIKSLPQKVTVVSFKWRGTADIEEYRTFTEQDWQVPSGGRYIKEEEAVHHYDQEFDHYETVTETKSRQVFDHYDTVMETKTRQVFDHYDTVYEYKSREVFSHYEEYVVGYRDLGNGYAEEITSSRPVYTTEFYTETHQEPVYRTETYEEPRQEAVYRTEYYEEDREVPIYNQIPVIKTLYTYEIERWTAVNTLNSYSDTHEKNWDNYQTFDNQRLANKREVYLFTVETQKGKQLTFETNEDLWESLKEGDVVRTYLDGYRIDSVEKVK